MKRICHPIFKSKNQFLDHIYNTRGYCDTVSRLNRDSIITLYRYLLHKEVFIENGIEMNVDSLIEEMELSEERKFILPDKYLYAIVAINAILNHYSEDRNIKFLRENFPVNGEIQTGKYNFEKIYSYMFEGLSNDFNQNVTRNFNKLLKSIDKSCGLYFLYNLDKDLIYIGKSKYLFSRVQNSILYREAHYCKFLKLNSLCECDILEPYYIALLNPKLNNQLKSKVKPSFEINHKFTFTELEKIYK